MIVSDDVNEKRTYSMVPPRQLLGLLRDEVAADIRLVALRADPSDPLRGLSLQGATPPGLRRLLESRSSESAA